MIKTSEPKVIWNSKCLLGEGTLWIKEHNSIYFVDIKKKKIFILNIKNQKKKIIKVNKEIGFLAHIKKNIFILGLKGELRIQNLKTNKKIKSILIEEDLKLNRINDGKTDPLGNLWFGTMDNLERNLNNGSLYKLDKNLLLTKVDKNYMITNGPAFINPYNFYHTDSRKKVIYKIKIGKNDKLIEKKIFKKFSKNDGSPDGMTLDNRNNLWVCHYGGASISVFNKNSKLIHKIKFPAKNITNCCFGGPNNKDLFVSSALKGMSTNDIKNFNKSGSFFIVNTNVLGKNLKSLKLSQSIDS
jgi:sugar lactone lactonase YvrE